jgi:hypothetical protein
MNWFLSRIVKKKKKTKNSLWNHEINFRKHQSSTLLKSIQSRKIRKILQRNIFQLSSGFLFYHLYFFILFDYTFFSSLRFSSNQLSMNFRVFSFPLDLESLERIFYEIFNLFFVFFIPFFYRSTETKSSLLARI